MKLLFIVVILLIQTYPVQASSLADYQNIINDSFASFEKLGRKQWSYKLSRSVVNGEDKETTVEVFDPALPDGRQWQLLKSDEQAPSDIRLEEYRVAKLEQHQVEQAAKDESQQKDKPLVDMIDMDSLSLINESEQLTTLSFTPTIEDMGDDAQDKLTGTLIIDNKNRFVTTMKIHNTANLSPHFSVTLKRFNMAFTFTRINQVVLPQHIALDVEGQAAMVKKINQHSSETYSEYKFVGKHANAVMH